MANGSVQLQDVSKRFYRGTAHDTLRDLLASGIRRLTRRGKPKTRDSFQAMENVTFQINPGEAVGLIGANGAGKSTALKIISRIMKPDTGTITTRGRLTALIEIGAGFHGDLTGRENVYMNASVLGMRKPEIDAKLDAIVAFSGVEAFLDTPVKRYSSGMQARLGFSVAAHVDPDVLLVDEVLSVGDVLFRQRCVDHMQKLVNNGTALLFVTHHLEQMQSFCSRAVVIDRGKIIHDGHTTDAVARYIDALKNGETSKTQATTQTVARVTGLVFKDKFNRETLTTHAHDTIDIDVRYELAKPVTNLVVEIDIRRDVGSRLANFSSIRDNVTFNTPKGAGCTTLKLPALPFLGGQYFFRAILRDPDSGNTIADTDYRFSLFIEDDDKGTGVLCLPHEWQSNNQPQPDIQHDIQHDIQTEQHANALP